MEYSNIEDALKSHFPFNNARLIKSNADYIKKRLGSYSSLIKKIYVEEKYIDLNWRSLYSHHSS